MANRTQSQSPSRNNRNRPSPTASRADSAAGAKPASTPLGVAASDEVKRPAPAVGDVQPRRAERRPDMIKRRRDERYRAYERQRRSWLLTRVGLAAFAVLVVAAVGFAVVNVVRDRVTNQAPDGTLNFDYVANDHTASLEEEVQYAEVPPVGGRHAPAPYWQNCGYYSTPIREESGVHSLEHGAVWITYQPTLPQDQIDELRELSDDQDYILVSPFEGLPTPVVASSWGHQVQLESANDERLDQFIRRFKEGPDTPEPGALCSRGVGTPE